MKPAQTRSPLTMWGLIPLFLLSGMASLVYEVIWSRQLVHVMGGTTYAITTVLVAFMGGLALGAFLAGRLLARISQPQRAYAILEILIGAYALLTPALFAAALPLYRVFYAFCGDRFDLLLGARFAISVLFLLVPTTLMGATLPLLVQYLAVRRHRIGGSIAILYGVNTMGAVIGSALAGYFAIPWFGLRMTTLLAAGVNVTVGLLAWWLPKHVGASSSGADPELRSKRKASLSAAPPNDVGPGLRKLILTAFFLSGVAAMIYQVCWIRALIMSIGPHTYGFTCILVAYIAGIGLGSLAVSPFVDRFRSPILVFGVMELGIAAAALIGVPIFGQLPLYILELIKNHRDSFNTILIYELLVVFAVLIVPTGLMGAIFPVVNRLCARNEYDSGKTVSTAYAVNTLGTILGTILGGFVLIPSPWFGVRTSILAAVGLSAVIGIFLIVLSARPRWRVVHVVCAGVGGLLLVFAFFVPSWNRAVLNMSVYLDADPAMAEQRILYYREGVDATVAVTAREDIRILRVNGKNEATNGRAMGYAHIAFAHLAIASATDAEDVMIVGLGSGLTLGSMATHSEIRRIDCAEMSEAVIDAARQEFSDFAYDALDDPRVNLIRADARNHLLMTEQKYDVILSIPSNPWTAGVANLFTQEFFEICRARLKPHGRMCAWFQVQLMAPEDVRTVVRTVTSVFPYATIWRGSPQEYMIVAAVEPFQIDAKAFSDLYADARVGFDLERIGYRDAHVLAGSLVAGGDQLKEWSSSAPIHTDDNALLEFSSPRVLFNSNRDSALLLQELQKKAFIDVGAVLHCRADQPSDRQLLEDARRGQAAEKLRIQGLFVAWLGRVTDAINLINQCAQMYPEQPQNIDMLRVAIGQAQQLAVKKGDRGLLQFCEPMAQWLARQPKLPIVLPETTNIDSAESRSSTGE